MSVTKTAIDKYDVRANDEWATICIREWTNERYFGGEILIHSSFGSWANSWNACGCRFRKFIIECDFDYLFGKFMGASLDRFDGEGSINNLKSIICRERSQRSIGKVEAREFWDELDLNSERLERSVDSFVEAVYEISRHSTEAMRSLMQEPWDFTTTKHDGQAVGFWHDLWPEFSASLRHEMSVSVALVNSKL